MTRCWYVSPYRIKPGSHVPGQYVPSYGGYDGPSPDEMRALRGPFPTAAEASVAARDWEDAGRRSNLWLLLVVDDWSTHCSRFDPAKAEPRQEAAASPETTCSS